jgi:transcription elongation factor Elf1
MAMSFNRPLYIVASDHIFNKSLPSKLMQHLFSPIKKKKAMADISFIIDCVSVAKSGGNVLIYPEGNRAWADFQFYIDRSIVKLVRVLKLPLMLYNLKGGYGVNPRWGNGLRKGDFKGVINKIYTVDQLKSMTDDELYSEIINGLKVIDSESGNSYKSKVRAEYLERVLFVCPVCKKESTLVSKGEKVICKKCGLEVEYTEDLKLKSKSKDFSFTKLVDWYKFQLDYIKAYKIPIDNSVIFADEKVRFIDKTTERNKKIGKGSVSLNKDAFILGKKQIEVSGITSLTVIGGTKLIINTQNSSIMIKGHERFNPLKYVLIFNVLRPDLNEKYYGLDLK